MMHAYRKTANFYINAPGIYSNTGLEPAEFRPIRPTVICSGFMLILLFVLITLNVYTNLATKQGIVCVSS